MKFLFFIPILSFHSFLSGRENRWKGKSVDFSHGKLMVAKNNRFSAILCTDETYAMVYAPNVSKCKARMDVIKGQYVEARWYNPPNGEAIRAGKFKNTGIKKFTTPNPGTLNFEL